MKKYKDKGFTLIELLIVIVIISILAVFAVIKIGKVMHTASVNAFKVDAGLILKAIEQKQIADSNFNPEEVTEENLYEKLHLSNKYIEELVVTLDENNKANIYVEGKEKWAGLYACGNKDTLQAGDESTCSDVTVVALTSANNHLTEVPEGYTGIYTLEDLNDIRNDLSGNYILMNDLDFNNEDNYQDILNKTVYTTGTGWEPIGTSSTAFTGSFNGNNYVINHLFINRTSSYVGLFGYTNGNSSKIIENIGLENINISGSSSVGGIVGQNRYTSIKNSYVTGVLIASSSSGGGITGYSFGSSSVKPNIENCYSTVNVTALYYAGGAVGYTYYTNVTNVYATGDITSTGGDSSIYSGLLIGRTSSGVTITNSYKSDKATLTKTIGNETTSGSFSNPDELKSEVFINNILNWDIVGIWDVSSNSYPKLGGTYGVNTNPVYEISTIEDLYSMRKDLAGNYTLMNDLDFNSVDSYNNSNNKVSLTSGYGWIPVGNDSVYFTGSFNGNGHVIKNLYINRNISNVGLFGRVNGNNTKNIEQLGLENVNITGGTYTGGIVGRLGFTTIKNCYATGSINSTNYAAGGIAGWVSGNSTTKTTIENSYSTTDVAADYYAGGVAGYITYTDLNNCFGTGDITSVGGDSSIYSGLLIGRLYSGATVTNSYKSNEANITIANGSETTTGTFSNPNELKLSVFVSSVLNWDTSDIWDVTSTNYPTFGKTEEGINEAVYEITKIEDLYLMRKDLAGDYILMNDLDFNSDSSYRNPVNKTALTTGYGWIPVGSSASSFNGTLIGNNHVIKNLYINRTGSDIGLFGSAIGGSTKSIEKLGLENVNITGTGTYIGGFIGRNYYTSIKNSYVTGNITSSGSYAVGGLIGWSDGTSTTKPNIENCYSTANITATYYAGGLIGYLADTNIINSFAAGNITGTGGDSSISSGLFIGRNYGGSTITNSYRSNEATLTISIGSELTTGTLTSPTNLQNLSLSGLNLWDTSTIWQINAGNYPTLK